MHARVLNAPQRSGRLVLGVDDAPDSLFLLGRLAETAGYAFIGAPGGAECLSLTFRCVPRLILLDIEMPEMSGFETCRRLRANPELVHVPIAFLTARKSVDDVSEGLAAGGNDFILKPFVRAHLLDRIEHWTSRRV